MALFTNVRKKVSPARDSGSISDRVADQTPYEKWIADVGADPNDPTFDLQSAFRAKARPNKQGVLPAKFMTAKHPDFGALGQVGSDGFLQQTQNTVGGRDHVRTMDVAPSDAVARAALNVGRGVAKDFGAAPKASAFDVSLPQTEFQKRDQAAFDSRFDSSGHFRATATAGQKFIPFPGPAAAAPATAPVTPPGGLLAQPSEPLPARATAAGAVTSFDPIASVVAGAAPAFNPAAPTPPPPSEATIAGQDFGTGVRKGVGAVTGAVTDAIGSVTSYVKDAISPLAEGASAVSDFAGGVASGANSVRTAAQDFAGGAGKSIASGVSNSQAAGFQQPTAASPAPVTPTTPVADVNKTPEAISRFKSKTLLAGF